MDWRIGIFHHSLAHKEFRCGNCVSRGSSRSCIRIPVQILLNNNVKVSSHVFYSRWRPPAPSGPPLTALGDRLAGKRCPDATRSTKGHCRSHGALGKIHAYPDIFVISPSSLPTGVSTAGRGQANALNQVHACEESPPVHHQRVRESHWN